MASRLVIRFDNKALFGTGAQSIQVLSWRREVIEHGFGGLGGLFSVDLGRRGRKLKQRGCLSAVSVEALNQIIENINGYLDGQAYELIDQFGQVYEQVRMDSFVLVSQVNVASQVRCEYEINYTQLGG